MNSQPVKAVFSRNYKSVQARVKKLPEYTPDLIKAILKRDALMLNKNFHDGIKNRSFHLEKLSDSTIKQKRYLGYRYPNIPLYGAGDDQDKNSYINMLRLRKVKNGYIVRPSIAKHWNCDLPLRALYQIHEFGKLITYTSSTGKVVTINIPRRPALHEAFKKLMRERSNKDRSKILKDTISNYLKTGNKSYMQEVMKNQYKDLAKYEAIMEGNQ